MRLGLLVAGVLVSIVSGTVGVASRVGWDEGEGVGLRRSCPDVGRFFPLGTVALLGLRTLRLDGHC